MNNSSLQSVPMSLVCETPQKPPPDVSVAGPQVLPGEATVLS